MRVRFVIAGLPVLAAVLLLATPQADASTAPAPMAARSGASPASRILDDIFDGVSCTTQPDNPSLTSVCQAVGIFADGPYIEGLDEWSTNTWGSNTFGGIGNATEPLEVSCVPQLSDVPACVAVGERFNNPKYPVQLVSTGGYGSFSPVAYDNPKGAKWSVLDDVSCASTTFCMTVGEAGTTRRTSHGLRYIGHAAADRFDGSALHPLKVPAPAHARTSELAGVSCPTTTSCMAVGNYTNSAGRSRPYSALWSSGTWTIHTAKTIHGKAQTLFQDVSCFAAGSCMAVGDAVKPGSAAFAEQFSGSVWTAMPVSAGSDTGFNSVSCPAMSYCVAVGARGSKSLIQVWGGSAWAAQPAPVTKAPFTTDDLLHVSCVSPTACTAVGYRHNPKVRYSYRTLALAWSGSSWVIQSTYNE
jgi:hypothetical protein